MKVRSLRTRLTLFNAFVLACVLILSGAVLHFVVRTDLTRQVDAELLGEASSHEQLATEPNGDRLGAAMTQLRNALGGERLRVPVRVFDATGSPSSATRLIDPHPPGPYDRQSFQFALKGATDFRSIRLEGQPYRLISFPVRGEGQVRYVIQTVRYIGEQNRTVQHLNGVLLHLIPFALLVSVIGGAVATGRSLRPIRDMAATAETIDVESLRSRLPERGNDELGRLAAVFNRMLERLQTSFDSQGRFIADASHELRTPLTALKANTSLALAGPATIEEYRSALEAADRAADRMTRLVGDLLLISRSDAGELDPAHERIDVAKVAGIVVEMFGGQAVAASVDLQVRVETDFSIIGDHGYLERILANLVANALRHTPPGGTISISAAEGEIHVRDSGCGIAAEHLPHLFDRFYRVDPSRSRAAGGTGLGLAICQGLAHAMGGTITVTSALGAGTEFVLTLPRGAHYSIPCTRMRKP